MSKSAKTTHETQIEKAEAEQERIEEKRKADSLNLVGCLVHYYPAPAEGISDVVTEQNEKERREGDPVAAIITSVQPDGDEGQTIVNLQVFAPDGTSPAFGVDLVDDGKGEDGTPFCVLIAA